MPPVVAAVSGFLVTTIGVSLGSVVTTIALSGAAYILNKALAPKLGGGSIDQQAEQKVVQRAATPVQRIIYGRSLVAGDLFFLECKPPYLYYGLILASHEIDGIDEIRIGDVLVNVDSNGNATNAPYYDGVTVYAQFSIRNGTDTQAIDPILAADFTELPATFRQLGHATVVVKMHYGASATVHEKVWGAQAPQTKFIVRGKKVFNPNDPTQSFSDPTTWKFSDTASLCVADYLTFAKGGRVSWNDIDIDALKIAAAADEINIQLASGSNEKRYTCNGVITLDNEPIDNIQNLLTANIGRLIWHNGKYAVLSGVARTASWTITDDTARGGMEMRYARPKRELVNTVRTRFTAPDREYQLSNGPVLQNASYLLADGEEFSVAADLPFTSTHTRAQRIGKIIMEKSRLGKYVTRRESLDAIRLSAADIVNIQSNFLPSSNSAYELNVVRLEDSFEFDMEFEEYDSARIYAWDPAVDEKPFTLAPAELAGVN